MSRRTASPRRRAATLIEAVLYISIAISLIVGALVFYRQASLAQRFSESANALNAILADGRALASSNVGQYIDDNILYAAGSIPENYILHRNGFVNISLPWQSTNWAQTAHMDFGSITETGATVTYIHMEESLCVRSLITNDHGQTIWGPKIVRVISPRKGGMQHRVDTQGAITPEIAKSHCEPLPGLPPAFIMGVDYQF
jgi:hypothetical protein